MRNSYYELCDILKEHKKKFSDIKYCRLSNFDVEFWLTRWKPDYFVMNYNDKDSVSKLKKRLKNYNYDSWYGGQELFWEIVFNDGTWLERWEYDGSEWREYKKTPEIKDYELFRNVEKKWNYEETHSVLDV